MTLRWRFIALSLALACSRTRPAETEDLGPRGDSRSITRADLTNATQLSLLDFIAAERAQWLRTPDGHSAAVVVYVDGSRLGGASTLKGVTLSTVARVRYYDVAAAQQKFSLRDYAPVIEVVTR